MRIAFVTWRFPVLSEAFILNQIAGLLDRGHDVRVHAFNGYPDGFVKAHPIVERYGMMRRAYLTPARPERKVLATTTSLMGYKALRHPSEFTRLAAGYLRSARTLEHDRLKFFHRAAVLLGLPDYDVVHCQFGN
ncbi:MAG: colanic acid biosynthesis glycosyltransferase WcaL, partial [Proteobacteria bacterium]|nr:colanic acid biosynthesis glycosyltransferase WcaL [Pseudomonadota bacterium]